MNNFLLFNENNSLLILKKISKKLKIRYKKQALTALYHEIA
jgi:hypothetical protein